MGIHYTATGQNDKEIAQISVQSSASPQNTESTRYNSQDNSERETEHGNLRIEVVFSLSSMHYHVQY